MLFCELNDLFGWNEVGMVVKMRNKLKKEEEDIYKSDCANLIRNETI